MDTLEAPGQWSPGASLYLGNMRSIPRELTLADVHHPDVIHGRSVVRLGTNLHELADRLKNGDPTVGWEGDPRLTLAKSETHYELWRLEADGQYRMVCRLNDTLDPSNICRLLVERDARRGFDLKEHVDRHNAQVQAARQAPARERMSGAADKLAWALKKDLGVRTHWAAPARRVGS